MGACCGKPASGATAHPPAREGWASRSDTGGDTLGGRVPRGGDPVLAFVGLNGAGKTALLHTLTQRNDARVSETPPRTPRDDDADGTLAPHLDARGRVLCAPPPTNAVEIRRARAAGTSFVAVDVPGVRADRLKWRLAIEREDADIVVFVVDAADHVRAPVAREELWALCGVAHADGDLGRARVEDKENHRDADRTGASWNAHAAVDRENDGAGALRGRELLVLATKSDVRGAASPEEVSAAFDLDRLAKAVAATSPSRETPRVYVEGCTATSRASVVEALRGVLGR